MGWVNRARTLLLGASLVGGTILPVSSSAADETAPMFPKLGARKEEPPKGASAGRIAEGICLSVLVFAGGIAVAKKRGYLKKASGERRVRILERTPVTGKTSLLVIEYDGRRMLCAVGPDRVTPLDGRAPPVFDELVGSACDEELRYSA